jgi:BirA family biotin operon repressor/biotin-[acetyl-CoA-carboxylase] ligase
MELLDKELIKSMLNAITANYICDIYVHNSLNSTNTWLMQQAENGAPNGTVCLAEQQTAGRGRHGRTWISPPTGNLYLSLLWRYPQLTSKRLSGLSLVCSVAVARALWKNSINGLTLKWPNDLLLNERKLAGLLLEARTETDGSSCIIIGLGINIHLPKENAIFIDQPYTSLNEHYGESIPSRNMLIATILNEIIAALIEFSAYGLQPFIADWYNHDALTNKQVHLINGNQEIIGNYLGIGKDGNIILNVNGIEISFYGGEIKHCRI